MYCSNCFHLTIIHSLSFFKKKKKPRKMHRLTMFHLTEFCGLSFLWPRLATHNLAPPDPTCIKIHPILFCLLFSFLSLFFFFLLAKQATPTHIHIKVYREIWSAYYDLLIVNICVLLIMYRYIVLSLSMFVQPLNLKISSPNLLIRLMC